MKFTKMQGIGNDYVYVNGFEETVEDPAAAAVFVSNRNFGIGSDGLILILPSETADCRMDMYNMDGSRGAMCGNGIRCVGKYVYDHGIVTKTEIDVETASGLRHLSLHVSDGKVDAVTVDMGSPVLTSEIGEPIRVGEETFRFTGISMGNPHAVVFLDEAESLGGSLTELKLSEIGPKFETHERFPDRVNTEFVQVLDRKHVKMRVWERGSGETLACGTGACAAPPAWVRNGRIDPGAQAELLRGSLSIRWDRKADKLYMTGPAVEVFSGEIELPKR